MEGSYIMNNRSICLALKVRYSSLSTFLEECLFDKSPGEILIKPNHPLSIGDGVLLKVCFTSIPEELIIEGIVEENTATAWRVRFAGMALDQQRRLSRLLRDTKDRRPSKAKVLILQGNPHAVSSRVQVQEIEDWAELHGWCEDVIGVVDSVDAWCAALDGRAPWTTFVDADDLPSPAIAQILSRVRDTASSTGIVTSTRPIHDDASTVHFLSKPLHYGKVHQALTTIARARRPSDGRIIASRPVYWRE